MLIESLECGTHTECGTPYGGTMLPHRERVARTEGGLHTKNDDFVDASSMSIGSYWLIVFGASRTVSHPAEASNT